MSARTFRSLPIGATFDFVGPDRRLNSFFSRCTKVSARGYTYANPFSDSRVRANVGRIDAAVYHVSEVQS